MKENYKNKMVTGANKKVKPTFGHTFDFPPHDISFRADSMEEATKMFIEWKRKQGRGNSIKNSEVKNG